jgi:hypothetical protein
VAGKNDTEASAEPKPPQDGGVVDFPAVLDSERSCIAARRAFLKKESSPSPTQIGKEPPAVPPPLDTNLVGLALSGGGIRSAAFCLGVLQALDAVRCVKLPTTEAGAAAEPQRPSAPLTLLERVDYLSTVSGGGYIGCSLAASLSNREGKFPFPSELISKDESDSIKHIRDNSNYLFPDGMLDFFPNCAIYLRGLFANFVIVLPFLLTAATFTIYCSPHKEKLSEPMFYNAVTGKFPWLSTYAQIFDNFAFTRLALSVLGLLLLFWSLYSIGGKITGLRMWKAISGFVKERWSWFKQKVGPAWTWLGTARSKVWSWLQSVKISYPTIMSPIMSVLEWQNPPEDGRLSEVGSRWAKFGGWMLIVVAVCAISEAQPLILQWLFEHVAQPAADAAKPVAGGQPVPPAPGFNAYVSVLVGVLTAIASVVGLLADKLAKVSKYFSQATGWLARAVGGSSRLIIYIASAALPLTLWILYLLLSFWGISRWGISNKEKFDGREFAAPDWLLNSATSAKAGIHSLIANVPFLNWALDILRALPIVTYLAKLIDWAIGGLDAVLNTVADSTSTVGAFYFLIGVVLFLLSMLPTLNANSLHRLYRDRLSNAFIFYEPLHSAWAAFFKIPLVSRVVGFVQGLLGGEKKRESKPEDRPEVEDGKIRPLDRFKLTELKARFSPYLIVNTALNIQGSKYVNRRGRNADFFMFSRNYTGSEATKYVATQQMEWLTADLNLATAMAVSGAAASSNMGSQTIRPLTPTLTILNIRLGYWLRNPSASVGGWIRALARILETANIYVFKEMFGLLTELSYNVYLTDGGHIENLGIYQLLKRRCKLIIAVDAEEDAGMNFESLVKLQRYARIDLGARIDLPWQEIRTSTLATGKSIADNSPDVPSYAHNGPHCAVGVVEYSKTERGYLIYIKSSLTGDENDYIVDYKRRNPTFPHETTGDQMFTEEQFEVYRALGFHAAYGAFADADGIATLAPGGKRVKKLKWNGTAKAGDPMSDIHKILEI